MQSVLRLTLSAVPFTTFCSVGEVTWISVGYFIRFCYLLIFLAAELVTVQWRVTVQCDALVRVCVCRSSVWRRWPLCEQSMSRRFGLRSCSGKRKLSVQLRTGLDWKRLRHRCQWMCRKYMHSVCDHSPLAHPDGRSGRRGKGIS